MNSYMHREVSKRTEPEEWMMKSRMINIVGLLIDNKFVEFSFPLGPLGTEVLLLECKTDEEDAIVISVDSENTIVLKLGEIKEAWKKFIFESF